MDKKYSGNLNKRDHITDAYWTISWWNLNTPKWRNCKCVYLDFQEDSLSLTYRINTRDLWAYNKTLEWKFSHSNSAEPPLRYFSYLSDILGFWIISFMFHFCENSFLSLTTMSCHFVSFLLLHHFCGCFTSRPVLLQFFISSLKICLIYFTDPYILFC